MRTTLHPITCNGRVIMHKALIPDSILEKLIGLRWQNIDVGYGMVFEVTNPFFEVFDTYFCKPMGCIAVNEGGVVLLKGVMYPNSIKLIRCNYWIESHPSAVNEIHIGDIISGLQ